MRQSERKIIKLLQTHGNRKKSFTEIGYVSFVKYEFLLYRGTSLPELNKKMESKKEYWNEQYFNIYKLCIFRFKHFFPTFSLSPACFCCAFFSLSCSIVTRRFSRWLHKNNNTLEQLWLFNVHCYTNSFGYEIFGTNELCTQGFSNKVSKIVSTFFLV